MVTKRRASAVVGLLMFATSASADQLRCGVGTVKVKGVCEAIYNVTCGAGTHEDGGECLPNVTCGAGTHQDDGEGRREVAPSRQRAG
jgi:hypothetical protein